MREIEPTQGVMDREDAMHRDAARAQLCLDLGRGDPALGLAQRPQQNLVRLQHRAAVPADAPRWVFLGQGTAI